MPDLETATAVVRELGSFAGILAILYWVFFKGGPKFLSKLDRQEKKFTEELANQRAHDAKVNEKTIAALDRITDKLEHLADNVEELARQKPHLKVVDG